MRNYRDLEVWRRAHELTLCAYKMTANFPKSELYGLVSQLRRTCVSIEANLAEGCGRWGDGEMARFVQIAMGSASELDCHLQIARDLDYLTEADHNVLQNQTLRVRRMLTSFLQAILRPDIGTNEKPKSQKLKAKSQGTGV